MFRFHAKMADVAGAPGSQRRLHQWLFPLYFFEAYLALTVLLFFFGPWPWPVVAPGRLFAYLVSAQAAILLGYLAGGLVPSQQNRQLDLKKAIGFFNVCLVISLVIAIPTSLARTGYAMPRVIYGLTHPGAVYLENYLRLQAGNSYILVEYARIVLSLFITATFPLLIYLWSNLNKTQRLAGCIAIVFNLMLYVSIGTNKGVADTLIILPFLLVASNWSGGIKLNILRPRYLVALAVALGLFLALFAFGQYQRVGRVGSAGVLHYGSHLLEADRLTGGYTNWMPMPMVILYESLTRYLDQGYFALSMAFDLEHSSTWGAGGSMFLARNFDAFFHTDYFTVNSLPYVLESATEWGRMTLWHSIYTWLASDVGVWGVIPVMAVFAFLLSVGWARALERHAVTWLVMLYSMLMLFFYIPANNQIFQSGESTAAFFFALICIVFRVDRWFLKPL